MSKSPDADHSRESPADEGLSLDKLTQAFAEMLGGGSDPFDSAEEPAPNQPNAQESVEVWHEPDPVDAGDACEITPRTILEAMLFVGHPQNEPLTSEHVAKLMRGVRAVEIDGLVAEINEQYAREGRPYSIVGEGQGYRMTLREEHAGIREQFYGKVRQARLSAAAVEVLSLIAYRGLLTSDEVSRMRGTPSGALLAQLVRRQLLAVERSGEQPSKPRYRTTQRFLDLFGLQSLDDLPRSQDIEKR